MRKIQPWLTLFWGVLTLLFLAGCANPANQNENGAENNGVKTLWEKTEGGYTQKVNLKETVENGIKTKALTYTLQEDSTAKRVGFGILKIESNNNVVYKGAIMAGRKTEAFSQAFWTNYKISCGQSYITMANTIGAPDKEDDYFEYIILGGISELQLSAFKNANLITVSLLNPENTSRNTTFNCDYNFIINLIKYF